MRLHFQLNVAESAMKPLAISAVLFVIATCLMAPCARGQDDVNQLYLKAHDAYDEQKYDEAIKDWSEALKINPKDATALFNRSAAYAAAKDFDKALQDLDATIQLSPKDPDAYELRADLYRERSIKQTGGYKRTPDTAKAIADYGEELQLRMQNEAEPKKWVQSQAEQAEGGFNFERAIAAWGAVANADPKDANAHIQRAATFLRWRERDNALPEYTEAIRIDPANAIAYKCRAELYSYQGNHAKAIEDYSEAIRIDGDALKADSGNEQLKNALFECYHARGEDYAASGQKDRSIADFDEAAKLKPEDVMLYRSRAEVFFAKGDWDNAIADYTHVLEIHNDRIVGYQSGAYQNRGRAYMKKGDFDHAIADFTKLMETSPQSSVCVCVRADAYAAKGDYTSAIADYKTAMGMPANRAMVCFFTARFYATCPDAKIRDLPHAIDLQTQACGLLNWRDAGYIDLLAAMESQAGKWDDAVAHEKQAIEVAGENKGFRGDVQHLTDHQALYEQKKPGTVEGPFTNK
jgi:tetratricopeptide (TPR) repeat protein